MPDQRYEAARRTVGTLLSTTSPKIEVPEWQRSYSWERAQIETFWQDLVDFSERYPDDNIVGEEYFLGSIVQVVGGPTNLLLDGQQRLATSTILLSVLRDARRNHTRDAATRLQNKYIADFDDGTSTTTYVLTLNAYDRDFFRAEIQDEPADPPVRPNPTMKSHGLIRKAREYFEARVKEHSESLGGGEAAFKWNLRVGTVLCDHMSLVEVTSSDEDNAAAVFETLNDRGIGLSTPDLLRNLLLRRAKDDAGRERIVAAWKTVLDVNDDVPVEDLLRHYWVSHRGDVKARKLYREIKGKIVAEDIDSMALSLDIAATAPVYSDICRGRDDDPELRRLLLGIRELRAKSLYPALLSGYASIEDGDKEPLRKLAQALTTLFVRYTVIGGRETTVLESRIYQVAAQLRKDKDFTAAICSLAALSPDDDEFVERFARASVARITTARYLLRELEHATRETAEVSVEGTDRVHVEHIYPQTPAGAKWEGHAAAVNRLGNMTLLGRTINTSIKNSDFAKKQTDGYAGSDILLTKQLMDIETWDLQAVIDRQRRMSALAAKIWVFPDGVVAGAGAAPAELAEDDVDAELADLPAD